MISRNFFRRLRPSGGNAAKKARTFDLSCLGFFRDDEGVGIVN